MKSLFTINLIIFILFYSTSVSGQEICKVLLPEIDSIYSGDCKNGLAHGKGKATGIDTYEGSFKKGYPNGKGIYIWENGDRYVGYWKNGKRDGEGDLSTKINKQDTVLSGLWKENRFKRQKTIQPKVTNNKGVTRYTLIRVGDGNEVKIKILKNGSIHRGIADLFINGSTGNQITCGGFTCFQDIEYPFRGTVKYTILNEIGTIASESISCSQGFDTPYRTINKYKYLSEIDTYTIDVSFAFEIEQSGSWEVTIYN